MAESVSAHANMAQVVEQLTRNEQVEGSSPSIGSLFMAWYIKYGHSRAGGFCQTGKTEV